MLEGKVAVVTGASRGIGAATAEKLASLGADVAIIYAGNTEKAEAVAAKCAEYGVKAKTYKCDVSSFEESKNVCAEIVKDFGTVSILINNAGVTRDGLLATMKEDDFDNVLDVNLKGAFNMIKHLTRTFMRARTGKIINVSSIAGIMGNAGQANYSASKAGLIGLTKSVARELAARNVTCNAVAPGFIQTDMTASFDESNPVVASIPLKRVGTPEDVAGVIAFLASPAADYVTGEVIRIDGGLAI